MKTMKLMLTLLAVLASTLCAQSIKLETEFKTKRISKGKVSTSEPVMLNNLKLDSGYGLYYTVFGIFDLTDCNSKKDVEKNSYEKFEHKFGFAHKFKDIPVIDSLKLDLGYVYTDYQGDMEKDTDTKHEAFLKLTSGLPLNPGVKLNMDTQNDYLYINPFISYDYVMPFDERITLKQELNLYIYNSKFSEKEFGRHSDMITCIYYKAYLQMKWNKWVSFGPLIEASWGLDHRVRDSWRANSKNNAQNFLVGLKIDIKF